MCSIDAFPSLSLYNIESLYLYLATRWYQLIPFVNRSILFPFFCAAKRFLQVNETETLGSGKSPRAITRIKNSMRLEHSIRFQSGHPVWNFSRGSEERKKKKGKIDVILVGPPLARLFILFPV